MSLVMPEQRYALQVKRRLQNPSNAVEDIGIDLKRKMPIKIEPVPGDPIPVRAEMVPCTTLKVTYAPFDFLSRDGGPSIEMIQRAVCKHTGISITDMKCGRRTANLVRPRHMAMYLAKTLTKKSLPYIGRRFGGKDHTTILSAVSKIQKLRQVDLLLDGELNALADLIQQQAQPIPAVSGVNPQK
jgi:hypothetical protein